MESSTSRPATSIPIPSRIVLRGIIQFLFAQDFKSVDIHKQLVSVYGESVMSESMVRRWVREFKAGRHSLEDESGRGRPSLITDELTTKIENAIRNDRLLTLDELHNLFPEISRSLIHEIVSEKLEFRKVCARWIPRELTPLHKATRPPYSPDLAPFYYHLFTKLKESLAGKRFQSDEEVQTAVTNWTKELAGSFYAEGISKLVSRYTKCIEIDGNYVEKD
ncbi:SETMR methyltransferase, partial [Acromyrmex charruanus]